MNGQPHTHTPEVERYWSYGAGPWLVRYGDTQVTFAMAWRRVEHWSPERLERKVAKATRKAIARHDAGSRAAQRLVDVTERAESVASEQTSRWSS